jgi:regulator of replication initiation timing
MKLIDIAKNSIKLIQKSGDTGINNIELSRMLQIPRRRIYDIIAILKAMHVIKTKREKGGTRLFWKGDRDLGMEEHEEIDDNLKENLTREIEYRKKLELENEKLKEKIQELKSSDELEEKNVMKFPGKRIIIKSPEKIKRVQSSKYQVFIEVDSPGVTVEAVG